MPSIGTLFLLNGLGAGVVCVMLATRLRVPAALAAIGLSAGALLSITISRYADCGLCSYAEPRWRGPMVISVIAEVIALASLAAHLAGIRSSARTRIAVSQ